MNQAAFQDSCHLFCSARKLSISAGFPSNETKELEAEIPWLMGFVEEGYGDLQICSI